MFRLQFDHEKEEKTAGGHRLLRLKVADREIELQVTLEYTCYPEHQAALFGGAIENAGLRNIEHFTNLLSFDLLFQPSEKFGGPIIAPVWVAAQKRIRAHLSTVRRTA